MFAPPRPSDRIGLHLFQALCPLPPFPSFSRFIMTPHRPLFFSAFPRSAQEASQLLDPVFPFPSCPFPHREEQDNALTPSFLRTSSFCSPFRLLNSRPPILSVFAPSPKGRSCAKSPALFRKTTPFLLFFLSPRRDPPLLPKAAPPLSVASQLLSQGSLMLVF